MSVRAAFSAEACARPRLSATASARLANTTVSHSQAAIPMLNTLGSLMASRVVAMDPTQTTNITGECHWCAGFSLRSASGRPAASWVGWNGLADRAGATEGSLTAVVELIAGPPQSGTGQGRA